MKKKQLFTSFFAFFVAFSFSQTKEDVTKITKEYAVEKIQEKITYFKKLEETEKTRAIAAANRNGWPIIIKGENGSLQELMKLTPDGFPIYYSTTNVNAAKSTRANFLNTGGGLGLTLDGQGMVARVWDGGTVRKIHNGFGGRVTPVDNPTGTTYSDHATHVTGTMIAAPWNTISANVKGWPRQQQLEHFIGIMMSRKHFLKYFWEWLFLIIHMVYQLVQALQCYQHGILELIQTTQEIGMKLHICLHIICQ